MGHAPEILATHTAALFAAAVRRAAELLRAGEIVALPTETVYGLAANALDSDAVARVFAAKGRPAHNPIIVHVASHAMADVCTRAWPPQAKRLADGFWPGPLTLILPKADRIPNIVTAGGPTVGLRWPAHPFMQAVIRECGFPLAAPSANTSNQLSPTSAAHVARSLGRRVPLIVDGGQCQVGIESTVVDLTVAPPQLLRPGMIHLEALAAVLGTVTTVPGPGNAGPHRSPGQLPQHYAPRARLLVLNWKNEAELTARLRAVGTEPARAWIVAHSNVPGGAGFGGVSVIPHDAEAFARALYAELHRGDDAGFGTIVVEQPPAEPEWQGIADRLHRAAATPAAGP